MFGELLAEYQLVQEERCFYNEADILKGGVERKQKQINKNSPQILVDFAEPLCQTTLVFAFLLGFAITSQYNFLIFLGSLSWFLFTSTITSPILIKL